MKLRESTAAAALEFALRVIDQTHEYAAAFKPNAAFFEALGPEGIAVLQQVIKAIPGDIPVILDVKRGDISTTASAYANCAFNVYGADSVTLSPYMGWDSIEPFVKEEFAAKGAFVLCKTSNPSSRDFQDLILLGAPRVKLFHAVATQVALWNSDTETGNNCLGLIAGKPSSLTSHLLPPSLSH